MYRVATYPQRQDGRTAHAVTANKLGKLKLRKTLLSLRLSGLASLTVEVVL